MTMEAVSRRRCTRVKLGFLGIWITLLVLRVFYGWEIHARHGGFMEFGEEILDALLTSAPFVAWIYLYARRARPPLDFVSESIVVLALVAFFTVDTYTLSARAYVWRAGTTLRKQMAALDRGETISKAANFGYEIRVDGDGYYWPCGGWMGGSHGLVYDPTGGIMTSEAAFGERVRSARHLHGAWYLCSFT